MPVDRARLKTRAFERRWERAGKDLCDLIGPTFNEGGAVGDSVSFGPVATDLQCIVSELSGPAAHTVIGGEAYVASNAIELKKTVATLAVTPRYQIKVHARDGKSERFFERPVFSDHSFMPLVMLKASLVRQGYQQ